MLRSMSYASDVASDGPPIGGPSSRGWTTRMSCPQQSSCCRVPEAAVGSPTKDETPPVQSESARPHRPRESDPTAALGVTWSLAESERSVVLFQHGQDSLVGHSCQARLPGPSADRCYGTWVRRQCAFEVTEGGFAYGPARRVTRLRYGVRAGFSVVRSTRYCR